MALGEYTSVRTANDQLDSEMRIEIDAHTRNPAGEQAELQRRFVRIGMSEDIATTAAAEVHANTDHAVTVHLMQELGLRPDERPSPWVAAFSSLLSFAIGAFIPIIPFIFGFGTLVWGLAFGGSGLLIAGALAAYFTRHNLAVGGLRQLLFGGIAVASTYSIGMLLDVGSLG